MFGFDWLGRNFAVDVERNVVLLFEPGTGEMLNIQVDFIDFHNKEILKYGYKIPLFLNGKDVIENLEVSDMEVYWEIMMPLMNL